MKKIALLLSLLMIAGLISCKRPHPHETVSAPVSQTYYCPMHPNYTADKPGTCPICGMDLVLKELETPQEMPMTEKGSNRASFSLSAEKQQKSGVTTALVVKKEVVKEIRASAKVAHDPDLVTAQVEYLEAKRLNDTSLLNAAKQRLNLFGMSATDIDTLKEVQSGHVSQGKSFWVYPTLYEYELPYAGVGQKVSVALADGSRHDGIIRYVDSILDPQTRTARLHVEVDADGAVKPEMSGVAIVHINLGEQLLVPKNAVISTGERDLVFVVHEGTHFIPTPVQLGAELRDEYVVKSGLKEGDIVVSSATFLIDSESKLKAALELTSEPVPTEHQH